MKLRDVKALKDLGVDELEQKLGTLRQELMDFRFQRIRGQVPDLMKGKNVRRDIARIMTFLKMKKSVTRS